VAGGDLGALKRLAGEARGQPLPAVSLELLAVALQIRGARGEAAALLRDGRGRHPADFWIHFVLGNSLHDPRHPDPATLDEALGCYWAAVALRPDSAPAHYNLGLALKAKGRLDEAIAEHRKAIDLDDRFALAHSNLGNALWAKGLLDEAIAEYRKAIDLDDRFALAHYNLGNALQAKGRLGEAIAEYYKAIEIDPKYAPAHNNLGNALKAKGRLDEAIAEYYKAIEIDDKLAPAHSNLGLALQDKGELDEAIAECQKAIDLDPKLALAHTNLGLALAAKGRLDEAIAEHQKAIDLDRKYAPAHGSLGLALHAKGLLDEAIAEYRKAIALDRKLAPAHWMLGRALLQQGRFAEARDATRRAHDLLPARDPLRARVAQQLQACERLLALDEKLPALLKRETQPADNRERLLLADLCQRYMERHAAAARFFSAAFAAEPKLADDLGKQFRYHAACSAALAAAGKGLDAAPLDGKERARLRRQALTWLRADLAAWGKLLEKDPKGARAAVAKTLRHWQQDPDLAPVRAREALSKLPEHERTEWGKLWADVDALRKKARGKE
jgi:tetratricopeptide (TPR) repeat protein